MQENGPAVPDRLRADARAIFLEALAAAEPAAAVRRHLSWDGTVLQADEARLRPTRRILVFGAGKAFAGMACGAESVLGDALAGGMGITRAGSGRSAGAARPARVRVLEAAHPIPDETTLDATGALLAAVDGTGPGDAVLFLLSGGASSLLERPPAGLGLDHLRAVHQALLRSGAPIGDVNQVRRHLSTVKGGRLGRRLLERGARCLCLVLSDVLGNPLEQIGSGPLHPDASAPGDALRLLERWGLVDSVPAAAVRFLREAGERAADAAAGRTGAIPHVVVGDNRLLAQAAVRAAASRGYRTLLLCTRLQGEARDLGRALAAVAGSARALGDGPLCILGSGETTVTVRGAGRGGRNTEAALAFAKAVDAASGAVLLCGASDGSDGPTDAAGAVADAATAGRGAERGLDAAAALADNDSYTYFQALDDLLITGPTGTNVNDLCLLLRG